MNRTSKQVFWVLCFLHLAPNLMKGQFVQIIPAFPTAEDTVTLIFDANQGNQALKNYRGQIYMHTALILDEAQEKNEWKYIQGEWAQHDPKVQLEKIGPNTYRKRFHIRSFYGMEQDENFFQMVFLFRNENASRIASPKGEDAFFYPELSFFVNRLLEEASGKEGMTPGDLLSTSSFDHVLEADFEQAKLILRNYSPDILQFDWYRLPQIQPSEETYSLEPTLFPQNIEKDSEEAGKIKLGDHRSLEIEDSGQIHLRSVGKIILSHLENFFINSQGMMGMRLPLTENERIYGGGQIIQTGDLREHRLSLYNLPAKADSNSLRTPYNFPFFISSLGYGLLFDNDQKGWADIGKKEKDIIEVGFRKGKHLRYYLILGDALKDIVQRGNLIMGSTPLPPAWAFGQIARFPHYADQKEISQSLHVFALQEISPGAIVFRTGASGSSWEWDLKKFPDQKRFSQSLSLQGIKTLFHSDPYVSQSHPQSNRIDFRSTLTQTAAGNPYVIPNSSKGPIHLIDVFAKAGKQWIGQHYKGLILSGAAGIVSIDGDLPFHPFNLYHGKTRADDQHNRYPKAWAALAKDAFVKRNRPIRPFNLIHAGTPGIQALGTYATLPLASHSWKGFSSDVSAMLNLSLSGSAYAHGLIGGQIDDALDPELFLRWIQTGVYFPLLEIPYSPQLAEAITQDDSLVLHIQASLRLRQQFFPYLYSVAHLHSHESTPIVLPHFSTRTTGDFGTNGFFLGERLWLSPVFEPNAFVKQLRFPSGNWVDIFTDKIYKGDSEHSLEIPVDRIPAFVQTGSIMPMGGKANTQEIAHMDTLFLHYWPPVKNGTAQFSVYTDDGLSYQTYASGLSKNIELSIQKIKKKFYGELIALGSSETRERHIFLVFHHFGRSPKKFSMEGQKLTHVSQLSDLMGQAETRFYDPETQCFWIHTLWDESTLHLMIKK